jgi:hypothetical protein
MKRNTFGLIAGLGVLMAAAPLLAHHSFSAEYDSNKPVTLRGIVTKVDWMNPHVYFYVDVETDGKVTNWGLEMGPPNMLERSGWTKNTIQIGTEVIVDGTLAKDGSKQANARSVTLADSGKKLGAATSEGKQSSEGKQ